MKTGKQLAVFERARVSCGEKRLLLSPVMILKSLWPL